MSVAAELELNLQVLARKGSISLQLESDQIPSEVFLEEEHLKEDTSPGTSGTSISRVFERGDGKTFQTLFQKDQTLGGIMKEFEPLMVIDCIFHCIYFYTPLRNYNNRRFHCSFRLPLALKNMVMSIRLEDRRANIRQVIWIQIQN